METPDPTKALVPIQQSLPIVIEPLEVRSLSGFSPNTSDRTKKAEIRRLSCNDSQIATSGAIEQNFPIEIVFKSATIRIRPVNMEYAPIETGRFAVMVQSSRTAFLPTSMLPWMIDRDIRALASIRLKS
jgi:hypothetical protein